MIYSLTRHNRVAKNCHKTDTFSAHFGMAQLSPALTAKPSEGQKKIPEVNLTPSMASSSKGKTAAPAPAAPVDPDVLQDAYGRKHSEPLFEIDVTVDEAKTKLMRNLMFAPWHKAYQNADLPIGPGRDTVPEDLQGHWHPLPWLLRDLTKAASPMLAWLHEFAESKYRIVLTRYDTEKKLSHDRIFHTDEDHTFAAIANLKKANYMARDGELHNGWNFKGFDYPIRYMLWAMREKELFNSAKMILSKEETMDKINSNTVPLRISILVLRGLSEATKKALRETSRHNQFTEEDDCECLGALLERGFTALQLKTELNGVLRNRIKAAPPPKAKPKAPPAKPPAKPSTAKPAPKKPEGPSNEGKKRKKKEESDSSSDSDSEDMEDDCSQNEESDDEPLSKKAKNTVDKEKVTLPVLNKKGDRVNRPASDNEEELDGSGSDSGTDDSDDDDDDESEEEDDSESEDAEDSDEEDKEKKKHPAKVGTLVAKRKAAEGNDDPISSAQEVAHPVASASEVVQSDPPIVSIAQNKKKASKAGEKGEKGEKPKRKPAKTRRQGTCTFAEGVLEQLDALGDAVPDSHQKRLNEKIGLVRCALVPYLNIGRVKHVKVVLEQQIALMSELGSIIAKLGVADGPKGPDAAASRHIGKEAAKLFAIHAPKINQLNDMIATWSGMVAEMNASVQKASTEMSRAASGLIASSAADCADAAHAASSS